MITAEETEGLKMNMSFEGAVLIDPHRIYCYVFIHGIGNGTLKHELRKVLDEYYHDLKYQDASFKEYGYGATLIFINK